jgi:hypothetical protein
VFAADVAAPTAANSAPMAVAKAIPSAPMPGAVFGVPMAVVPAPATAVSIAVTTVTMSLQPFLVDYCLCSLPSLLPPLSSPLSAIAVTVTTTTTYFFTTTIKFSRIDVICYGAEPMQLRCGTSPSSGRCSNCQSTVKVQGREPEVRGLVVLPSLPVSKGSPVRDERVPGMLLIPAPKDKEAVCMNNSN